MDLGFEGVNNNDPAVEDLNIKAVLSQTASISSPSILPIDVDVAAEAFTATSIRNCEVNYEEEPDKKSTCDDGKVVGDISSNVAESPVSKIPVSASFRKNHKIISKKVARRRSTKLPSVELDVSSDRIFDDMARENEALSPTNFSDGYMDQIISESCRKSLENLVDSRDDQLSTPGDVLNESRDLLTTKETDVKRPAVIDEVAEMTVVAPIATVVVDAASPHPDAIPMKNMTFVLTSTPHDSLTEVSKSRAGPLKPLLKSTANSSSILYETACQNLNVESLRRSMHDKSNMYETRIEELENRLKGVSSTAEEFSMKFEEAERCLRLVNIELDLMSDKKEDFEMKNGILKDEVNLKEEEIRALKCKLEDAKNHLHDKTSECEMYMNKTKDYEENFLQSELTIKNLGSKLETALQNVDDLKETLKIEESKALSRSSAMEDAQREIQVLKLKVTRQEPEENTELVSKKEIKGNKSDFLKKLSMFNRPSPTKGQRQCRNCLDLQEQIEVLKAENAAQVGEDVEVLLRSIRALEASKASQESRNEELSQSLKNKEALFTCLESDQRNLVGRNNQLEEDLEVVKAKFNKTDESVKSYVGIIEGLQRDVKRLESMLSTAEEDLSSLTKIKESMDIDTRRLEEELFSKEKKIVHVDEQLMKSESALVDSRNEVLRLTSDVQGLDLENKSLESKLLMAEEKSDELVRETKISSQKLNELEQNFDSQTKLVELVKSENVKLEGYLNNITNDFESYKKAFNEELEEILQICC